MDISIIANTPNKFNTYKYKTVVNCDNNYITSFLNKEVTDERFVYGVYLQNMYELRTDFSTQPNSNYQELNNFGIKLIVNVPEGSENKNRRLKQEEKTINFIKNNKNSCIVSNTSPKRIMNLSNCLKHKLPICLHYQNIGSFQSNWLMKNVPEIVKVIFINGIKFNPITIIQLNFLVRFYYQITNNNIMVVLNYKNTQEAYKDYNMLNRLFERFE